MGTYQLCWDCEKATGGCTWARRLKPVEGWVARKINPSPTKPYVTYFIESCPEFKRDSYNGGLRREPRKEIKL